MEEIRKVFEVFNLNDLSSDEDLNFDFPLPLDSVGEEDDNQLGMVEEVNVDPLKSGEVDVTSPNVIIGLDGAFFPQ
jgi:hypothetical protein